MTEKRITDQHHQTFDSIRLLDSEGNEFWIARQLAKVLEYSEYRHFQPVIERAKEACRNSGHATEDHFEDVLEMVEIGSGAKRQINGKKVRQTIEDLGGTMPEALPTPEASIKHLETSKKKLEKKQ